MKKRKQRIIPQLFTAQNRIESSFDQDVIETRRQKKSELLD
jgi:Neuraminidase (sialidase)